MHTIGNCSFVLELSRRLLPRRQRTREKSWDRSTTRRAHAARRRSGRPLAGWLAGWLHLQFVRCRSLQLPVDGRTDEARTWEVEVRRRRGGGLEEGGERGHCSGRESASERTATTTADRARFTRRARAAVSAVLWEIPSATTDGDGRARSLAHSVHVQSPRRSRERRSTSR